ncbi:MAG: hypothetical protein WD404_04030 [Solirubrobacterales bacterium]
MLLATTAAVGATPDVGLLEDDYMDPAGGAVCFTGPEGGAPADCVAWGSFPEGQLAELFDPQADAFGEAIPDGEALERDISRGEPGFDTCLNVSPPGSDDTGSSGEDFQLATPDPRNNADALPSGEHRCPPGIGIVSGPVSPFENPTSPDDADFTFVSLPSTEPGVEFSCFLDFDAGQLPGDSEVDEPEEGDWEPCDDGEAPHTHSYEGLADGFYRFWVRALGSNPTPGPATSRGWQVDGTAPQTTIDSTPPDPSSGFDAMRPRPHTDQFLAHLRQRLLVFKAERQRARDRPRREPRQAAPARSIARPPIASEHAGETPQPALPRLPAAVVASEDLHQQ